MLVTNIALNLVETKVGTLDEDMIIAIRFINSPFMHG